MYYAYYIKDTGHFLVKHTADGTTRIAHKTRENFTWKVNTKWDGSGTDVTNDARYKKCVYEADGRTRKVWTFDSWQDPNVYSPNYIYPVIYTNSAYIEAGYRTNAYNPNYHDSILDTNILDIIKAHEDRTYFEKEQVTDAPAAITVTVPYNNFRYDEDGTYLLGQSHPADPLFCNGQPVSRTKSGYFSFYTPLHDGENTFVFSQNGAEYTHTIWKNASPPKVEDTEPSQTTETETAEIQPILTGAYPASLTAVSYRDGLSVSVTANVARRKS
jgi:hypothetical protein